MKIIYILLLLFVTNVWSLSGPKEKYWSNYKAASVYILKAEKLDDNVKTEYTKFLQIKKNLEKLEYKEDEADKLEEVVLIHMKYLNDKIYLISKFLFVDYISWQNEASIKSATTKNTLIVTSHGYCAGGGWGYKNSLYHAFIDGCLLYGYGNVGTEVNSLTYNQSNIPVYGFKTSIGAGKIVSSLGVEVGLKLPLLYSGYSLDRPDQNKFPGYKVDEESPLMGMASLYTKWPVRKWFFQTEFSKVIGRDLTFWALGLGHTF